MSKIGKKPIQVPSGVEIKVNDGFVSVKSAKNELTKLIPDSVSIHVEGDSVFVKPLNPTPSKDERTNWGLARSLLQNMIIGVTDGFQKVLEFQGVGYKAAVKGTDLELGLGFSHPITVNGPEGISFKTEKNTITIMGPDKELVGKVAAKIRSLRKPEPYKGSGIKYQGEVIQRKAGKKAAATA